MSGRILRFVTGPGEPGRPADGPDDALVVVLDTHWTAGPADGPDRVGLRPVAAAVLAEHDLFAEATELLDGWVVRAGIPEALEIDGTSFWFQRRLSYWRRLHERLAWVRILDRLVAPGGFGAIELSPDADEALVEVARLVAERDGLALHVDPPATTEGAGPSARGEGARPTGLVARLRGRWRRSVLDRRRAAMGRRLARLAAEEPPRLLAITEHLRQRVDTPSGPRRINPYLDPPLARLAGSRLDPIELELDAGVADPEAWGRLVNGEHDRSIPGDLLATRYDGPGDRDDAVARAAAIADRLAGLEAPLVVDGVDLGRDLLAELVRATRTSLPRRILELRRARGLLAQVRPAGILLANEYGRHEWLAAAHLEGVPIAAVQHGVIHRWHVGYIHAGRPAGLALADRTYVYGDWERRLLLERSVYHDEELRVSGSPRLDLAGPIRPAQREAVRAELGVAPGDRMVVATTSWGTLAGRFYTPISLAAVIDRPLPGVHLVIKLHPRESDGEPYRRLIEGLARAGGFAPPPMTIVRDVDLYRLLGAADAHLGVFSTVLTEAVVTATPNLLVTALASGDLLGYVDAGVALPIADGAALLGGLDAAAGGAITDAARAAFLADHFRPGSASERIGDDLLGWLAPTES